MGKSSRAFYMREVCLSLASSCPRFQSCETWKEHGLTFVLARLQIKGQRKELLTQVENDNKYGLDKREIARQVRLS